jgi:hypothetical protein
MFVVSTSTFLLSAVRHSGKKMTMVACLTVATLPRHHGITFMI